MFCIIDTLGKIVASFSTEEKADEYNTFFKVYRDWDFHVEWRSRSEVFGG